MTTTLTVAARRRDGHARAARAASPHKPSWDHHHLTAGPTGLFRISMTHCGRKHETSSAAGTAS
jgi:hypothetical protein